MLQRHEYLCKIGGRTEYVLRVDINYIVTSLLLISDDVEGRERSYLFKQVLYFMPVALNACYQLLFTIICLCRKNID